MSATVRYLIDARGVHRATGELWVPAHHAELVWWVGDHPPDDSPMEAGAGVPVVRLSPADLVAVLAEPQDERRVLVVTRASDLAAAVALGLEPVRATLVSEPDDAAVDALLAAGVELLEQRLPNVTPRRRVARVVG